MKFLLKTIVILAALALLVILGMNNKDLVSLSLPPILARTNRFPAAYMYYGFFGVGFIVGAILMAGGGAKRVGGASSKPAK
jgi:uncharacterized membrane protein YciS (DUF1049 family)